MYSLLLIASNIFFYFLGRYATKEKETVQAIQKTITRKINKAPAGPIDFITPKEMHYRGSEQEKIDQKWAENMKKAGLK